jgi:hypothetical protein
MDCPSSIGAHTSRLASHSLGSRSHVAKGSNFVVLVLSMFESFRVRHLMEENRCIHEVGEKETKIQDPPY